MKASPMHILHVVGARPNFMKMAPVYHAAARRGIAQTIVHTGQHYDLNMSQVFFQELDLPHPDINLGVGSGSHAVQTATVMLRLEPVIMEQRPHWVLVYGDVNSTLAAAVVCAKLLQPVAHVEAGLRAFDRTMPEEVNRLLTDQVADYLFIHSQEARLNLEREGIPSERIHFVGNTMIDTLVNHLPHIQPYRVAGLTGQYVLVTLHRPSNVDNAATLAAIIGALEEITKWVDVVFPVHPRTRSQMIAMGYQASNSKLHLIEPVGYWEFLALQRDARAVVTDSGGVQEETTYLGVPCLTLRANTERPVTVSVGSNKLIGTDCTRLVAEVAAILDGNAKRGVIPPLWDGRASERIVDVLLSYRSEVR
jgi:UDP-N-acetylglucosamine 2-epimerase (non-hydrolysing)